MSTLSDEFGLGSTAQPAQKKRSSLADEFGLGAPSKQNTSLLGDLGTDLKRGVQKLPGIATGLADIPVAALTNKRFVDETADKVGELTGFQPKEWAEEARDEYSPERQAGSAEIDQAWQDGTAMDVAGAYATNPGNVAGLVAESLPQMLAGGVIGRGALAAGRATGVIGAPTTAAQAATQGAIAGGVGEGAVIAGGTMDQIDREVEPQRAAAAAAGAGVLGAATGVLGAKAAQRMGVLDAESAIAGGIQQTAGDVPGLARRAAGGALTEGVFEELPQSVQETMLQNWAEEKDLTEGLARSAVEGTLAGSAMGAAVNVIPPRKRSEEMGLDPNAGPLSAAAVTAVDNEQARLPAPERLALPAPDQTLYADGQGNVSGQGPSRDVDREQRPVPGREQAVRDFGPDMERPIQKGEAAGREGQLIRANRPGRQQSQREPEVYENERVQGLPAPRAGLPDLRRDTITVDQEGNATVGKAPSVPPADYVPGGRGMDQQTPIGKKYTNPLAAKNAIQKAGKADVLEAVKVGPKQFEVRAKAVDKRKIVNRDRDSVMQAAIRLGGIKTEWRRDTTGDSKGNKFVPGVGALWSDKTGTGLDDMASLLDQSGYVPAGEMERDGGVSWLQRALRDEASGIKKHAAPGSKLQEEQAIKVETDRLEAQAAQEEASAEFDSAPSIKSDLLDDSDILEIRATRAAEFAAELDALFEDNSNEPVASAPSADKPAEEAQRPEAESSGSDGAGEQGALRRPDTRAESESEVAPALELRSQTEQELTQQADAQATARDAEAATVKAEKDKAQADKDRNDFTLTGSDRVSDVAAARGQNDMFAPPTRGQAKAEWVNFPADSGTLNIPRAEMPQIKAEHRGAMVNFLNARDIAHAEETIAATELKPTQAEYSTKKVEAAKAFEGGDRSILISRDGHVLDGHHQWLAKRDAGEDVKVIRLDAPIRQLLDTVADFPSAGVSTETAGQAESVASQLTSMSVNELTALIDDVANEVAAPQTGKPHAQRSTKAKTAGGKPRLRAKTAKAERVDTAKPDEVSRAASDIAKSLGVNMSNAGMNALEGLTKLFGGPGRLNSGLSFDEETYAKAKPFFAAALADVQAAGKDLRDFIRALVGQFGDGVKPYILRYAQDLKQEQGSERTDSGVEPDSAENEQSGDGRDVRDQGPGESRQGDRSVVDGSRGQRTGSDDGVSNRSPAADGKRGDQQVDGEQPALEDRDAGNLDGGRGSSASTGGLYAERNTDQAADRAVEQAVTPRKANVKASNSPATLAEIKQQLPFLTEGQAEDVVFAEKRLMKPDGYGVLYTNGTGTGKTFTGLGVMARSAARGKNNILVVAPKQPIVDAWVKAGKNFFGLDIAALDGINDNGGSGIVATTYANLAANNSLALRDWDMVVADEAHYLSSAEDGANTGALTSLRALTMRRGYARELVRMQNPDMVEAIERLNVEAKAARVEENNALSDRLQAQASAIHARLDVMTKAKAEDVAAIAPADKPRAVFLSATPFAYEKNVAWAQEFLFDWGVDQDTDGQAYNSGGLFERFMIQHFGYRMRYNKLTAPDAKVDSGLMQRAFNSWLKREGALSARALDSEFDYDRLFVTVDSQIGRRVDDALKWLWNMSSARDMAGNDVKMSDDERAAYGEVNTRIAKDNFNYHARMYFLEAIKAREALPHIQAQLAAGRKVLVMHDFKKGGVVNPFRQTFAEAAEQKAYEHFVSEFGDLIRAFSSLPSPIDQLSRAFPDALVYNGSVSPKLRIQMQNDFNSDDDGAPRVMIAQGDAMREGVSIHDTSGKHPRVLVHLGMPVKPTASIQQEGRIYRTGQASNALFRYFTIGTSWERSAFASKIAARAGAAENLAMGEQARGLKQAFIDSYESADLYEPGFEGEGVGGKASDRAAAAALTPWDMAKSYYFGTKKQGAGRAARGREGTDYFATPEPVGLKMVEWADIRGGESVLEPSAGHGAIARWFPDSSTVRVIEDSAELASRVALHVDGDVVHGRFEDHNIVNKYDAIVMNPPYGLGGSVAIPHLAKAADHLREGGRVVALIPTGPAADKKFDNWFYGQDKNGKSLHPDLHLVGDVKMPAVTFERAGTTVATRVVIIERVPKDQADQLLPARQADLSSISDIGELFTRMESMEMRARVKPVEEEAEQTAPAKSVKEKGPKLTYAQKAAEGKPKLVSDEPIFEYTAKGSGKVMRGAVVRGISLEEVKEKYYKYAFNMDGGVFLREEFIESTSNAGTNADTRYRLADASAKGIPLFSAKAIAKKVSQATGLQVETVADEAALPDAVQAQIKRDGVSGRVAGVYHNGTSYLIASNLRDAKHAISTVLHEAIGHGGVKAVLGNRINPVMRGIYRDMPVALRNELERRYAGQTANLSAADAQVLIAEEYVAHLAETDPKNGVLDRLVAMLRQFIRSTFGEAAALKWTRNDLVQLLADARQAASNGSETIRYRESAAAEALASLPEVSEASEAEFVESLSDEQASTFARAIYKARGTDSPFFQRWFGKSRMIDKQGQPIAFVHRSYGERDTFDDADLGKNTGTPTATLGHFLARKDVGNVDRYGPVVEQFYIRMAKPKVVTQDQFEAMGDWSLTKVQAYRKTLMDQGYDGMYVQGLSWPVVFEGKNIKAKRNSGTFNETASARYNVNDQTKTPAFVRWFGDWQAARAEARLDAMAPITIRTPAEWKGLPLAELRRRVEASLQELGNSNKPLKHPEIGEVKIVKRGIGKALSASADPAKLLVLGDLRNAFENSIYANSKLAEGKPNVMGYDKLLARVNIDGQELVAVLTVETLRTGQQFYNAVTLNDGQKKAPVASPRDTPIAGERATSANTGTTDFVRRELERVNLDTVSKMVDADGRPLVMYHARSGGENFTVFRKGRPIFFAKTERDARVAASASGDVDVLKAYIRALRPANTESTPIHFLDVTKTFAKNPEADSVFVADEAGISIAVRDPSQIKSASENIGDFDGNNPDIRYSLNDDAATTDALRKLGLGGKDADGILEQIRGMTLGGLKAKVAEWSTRSEEGLFDGLAGIRRAEEAVGITDADSQGYVSARLATGIADVMHGVLHYAAPEWRDGVIAGKADTRGVLEILTDLGQDNLTPWLAWLGGKRAQMLKAQGRENNLTDTDIAELLAMGKGKEALFDKVYQDYAKTNEAVLDLAEQAGLIDKKERAKWATEYYVPFYRQTEDDGLFTGPRSKKGLSHQTAAIKALKGGTLPTNDLLTNMLAGWTKRIDAAMKNKALLEVVDNLQDSEYLTDESPRYQQVLISRNQIAQQIRKDRKALIMAAEMLGLPADSKFLKVANQLMKPENEGFEKLWTKVAPTDPDIIRVQRDGKSEYYRVNDESLLRGLKFMEGSVFNDPITRIGRTFKRLLTTGVTASPDFILRNFIRDAAHAWMINKDGFVLGKDSIKGMRDALREDQDYRDLMFAGGSFQGGYVHGTDPEASAQIIRRALEKKGFTREQQSAYLGSIVDTPAKVAGMLGKGWQAYRTLGDKVENANRLSTYKAAIAAGKSPRQAAYEAKDLMDYSLRGNFAAAQWFTDVVPFLNARMQGLYKLGRAVKGDKTLLAKEVAMKGAYIAMFSLLLAGLNDDDERYQALMDWDKDMHWHIFLGDQHFRIPKPFELGLVFGTVPERLLHALTGTQDGGDLAKAVSNGVFQTLAFNPVPQFYQPIRELQANRNFFRDSPIEDMSDEGKLPEARFDERTSALGRAVGQITGPTLGLSPKQLDHLVQGYTGTLGGYVLAMSSLIASGFDGVDSPTTRVSDLPVLKVLYQGDDVRSTQYQSEFYDMMQEADQLHRTVKSYRDEGKVEAASKLLEGNRDKLKHRPALGLARQQLGYVRKQMDAVYRDTAMDGAAKRRRLEELQTRSNQIAERVVRLAGKDF